MLCTQLHLFIIKVQCDIRLFSDAGKRFLKHVTESKLMWLDTQGGFVTIIHCETLKSYICLISCGKMFAIILRHIHDFFCLYGFRSGFSCSVNYLRFGRTWQRLAMILKTAFSDFCRPRTAQAHF